MKQETIDRINKWNNELKNYSYLLRYENNPNHPTSEVDKSRLVELLDIKNDSEAWDEIVSNKQAKLEDATIGSVSKLFKDLENGEISPLISFDGVCFLTSKDDLMYATKSVYAVGDYILKHEEGFGGEGQGDDYWVVFSLRKEGDEKFFQWDGWYASHDGGYLENLYEVTPKTVEVIKWVNVK